MTSDHQVPAPKRSGRRAGPTNSHATILAAGRAEFSAHGFEGTTMRAVADTAGVDAALIHHFFLSKGGLFIAAVQDVFVVTDLVRVALAGPRATVGERFARAYLGHWDDPSIRMRLVSVLRSATSFEGATAIVQEFLAETLIPITEALGQGRPQLRAALAGSYLVGVAAQRYVISPGLVPTPDPLLDGFARSCQYYLCERL